MTGRIALEIGGVLIVLFALREVFRDIFHPTRSGSLSDFIGRTASLLMRKTSLRPAVGPIALVAVILSWVLLIVSGFALIYCGLLPRDVSGPQGAANAGFGRHFLESVYLSLGSFDTFQTFGLNPKTDWLRLVTSIEGLIGISMITASVSWLVLLYPALERMRHFAIYVSILLEAEKRSNAPVIAELGVPMLTDLTRGVLQFRLDIILFPILLNFYATQQSATIAYVLPEMQRFVRDAAAVEESKGINVAGLQLQVALEELSRTLAERALDMEEKDMGKIFESFRRRST